MLASTFFTMQQYLQALEVPVVRPCHIDRTTIRAIRTSEHLFRALHLVVGGGGARVAVGGGGFGGVLVGVLVVA